MKVDGRTVETAWWGPPPEAAPTLVLLHEGLGCVGLWRSFPADLAAATGCGVFAYSRFGYGRSEPCALPRPLGYLHDEARLVLPRVLDEAGIRRAVLVGHSDGASIAAIHLGSVPDARIRGAVLMAPHFFVETLTVEAVAATRATFETGELRAKLARWHDHPDVAFRGWNDAWLDPGFAAFDLAGELARVRVPLLLLQGTDDPYGSLDQVRFAERATRGLCETAVMPGIRHVPHLEAPGATLERVRDFSARVLRPGEPDHPARRA